ncbi:alpha/beta hydrolase [Virgibacillus sp. 179-BFC.A HS]|uniref:Alpha/beta hydrolase n=1 Tax=Tigheibacillus jepli TaxID=3035914 RepID=A0ABU5CJ80_9BACI|nr:alpha/beta hydrolase [Virgibacillus sp. 179-BFC.A HS]MDY0406398.1 alpha/beta hydrolase [Virgibacillus sp. 179-BFC.A HS]
MAYKQLKETKLPPLKNKNGEVNHGAIRKKVYVEINGIKQGMIIESCDVQNPVLLFIHGGPGIPAYPLIQKSKLHLEKYFTTCYWDQRGTGMSYSDIGDNVTCVVEQLVEDLLAVTNFLRGIFHHEKIFLFGHSWGTLLEAFAVARKPELFHAYIASGQIGNQIESEKGTLAYLKRVAVKKRDKQAVKRMQPVHINKNYYKNKQYANVLWKYLKEYGGSMFHRNYSYAKLVLAYITCDAYDMREKINIARGMKNASLLLQHLSEIDLTKEIPALDIPVYIMQGAYDYQTTLEQANAFFNQLQAPKKISMPLRIPHTRLSLKRQDGSRK